MRRQRPLFAAGNGWGAVALALLLLPLLLAPSVGCEKKAADRAAEERQFLAPTDVSKLRPEARAHLPKGRNQPPTGTNIPPPR